MISSLSLGNALRISVKSTSVKMTVKPNIGAAEAQLIPIRLWTKGSKMEEEKWYCME